MNEHRKIDKIDSLSKEASKDLSSESTSSPIKENIQIEKPLKDLPKELEKEKSNFTDKDHLSQKDEKSIEPEHIKTE